uniref:Uncharacterized protein n=1 Tax=viral metagenome TaxID=1070528 RepID=A0A6C0C7I3_9ZZZZ
MSYKNMTNNDILEDDDSNKFTCSECNNSSDKYFIHMNIDNMDKYICSYLCCKNIDDKYGGDHMRYVVNIKDFQHLRPLKPSGYKENKNKFSLEYDYINEDRNEFIESLYLEDERMSKLEEEYSYISSSSDSDTE